MFQYTTGEIARLCGVSVRTVQYYDSRGILCPSQLSEGGRRLYSGEDLKRMRIICFLREMDLPLNTISQLLAEEHPEEVIGVLLARQEHLLRDEISQRQERLEKLEQLQKEVKTAEQFSVDTIGDIAYMLENKHRIRRIHAVMLLVGIPLEILEGVSWFVGLRTGIWLPSILGLLTVLLGSAWLVWYYYRNVVYICPQCHRIFKPNFREMFFAGHTINTRRLTCTHCGYHGFCPETVTERKEEA